MKTLSKFAAICKSIYHKLCNIWDAIIITYEMVMDHKKLTTFLTAFVLVVCWFGWHYGVSRIPNAWDCAYEAYWIDRMDNNNWEFNWTGRNFDEQCRRRRDNGTWVPYHKATDAGME